MHLGKFWEGEPGDLRKVFEMSPEELSNKFLDAFGCSQLKKRTLVCMSLVTRPSDIGVVVNHLGNWYLKTRFLGI